MQYICTEKNQKIIPKKTLILFTICFSDRLLYIKMNDFKNQFILCRLTALKRQTFVL